MTPPHELVRRVADVLRTDVAPATDGALPRSQAFRASAVLRRVARGLELADAHAAAGAEDRRLLAADPVLTGVEAPGVAAAVAALSGTDDHKAALARLVAALYDERDRVPEFERVLARVRQALRADLDRDLDVAR